jgi:hypothetical protein
MAAIQVTMDVDGSSTVTSTFQQVAEHVAIATALLGKPAHLQPCCCLH